MAGLVGRCLFFATLYVAVALLLTPSGALAQPDADRPRLVVLTDMGNEPDDSQTMVRLLLYANELDIEGLIAVTSRWLKEGPRPELIFERLEAYGQVRDNLAKHADGWPTEEYLRSRTAAGQHGYGMADVGIGRSSDGSDLIKQILLDPDPKPVHFAINAGSNTLAQALLELREELSAEEMTAVIGKIRVYDDAGQDNAGAWIAREFPDVFWVRSRSQVFALYGTHPDNELLVEGPYTWEPYARNARGQHDWARVHIQTNHGPLGELYPSRFDGNASLEGGGTSSWIGLVNRGLYDPEELTWGGWGGRFSSEKALNVPAKYESHLENPYKPFYMYRQTGDVFTGEGITGFDTWVSGFRYFEYNPIWMWRRGHMNDFAARMDWSIASYEDANHNPVAVLNGDTSDSILRLTAAPGSVLQLDASGSYDPDGDPLEITWFHYPDAGERPYFEAVSLTDPTGTRTALHVPGDAAGAQLHVILQVWDQNPEMPMVDYRRIVVDVEGTYETKNRPPIVSFARPLDGASFRNGSSVDVLVYADDPDGSIWNVKLYVNGTFVRQEDNEPYEWGTAFSDALLKDMPPGEYVLRARATDNRGASGEATAVIHVREIDSDLQHPWVNVDVGGPALTGSASGTEERFTMAASGRGVDGVHDEFHFLYREQAGDATIIARVQSQARTDDGAQAGVMMRDSADPGARHVMLAVTPSNDLELIWRDETGAPSLVQQLPDVSVPTWLRLERVGDSVLASYGPDGADWTSAGEVLVHFDDTYQLGLAVASRVERAISTATFENVLVSGVSTGISDEPDTPVRHALLQPYPNPFSSETRIPFKTAGAGHVQLELFDVLGNRVNRLVDGWLTGGMHEVTWDGRDASGRPLASGVYFCRLSITGTAANQNETQRLILVR